MNSELEPRRASLGEKPGAWFLLRTSARPAADNMALDEILLETAQAIGKPVLRFYEWTEAAATFGYSQKLATLERMTPLRPLVRRPTGGGLVLHDADWTYSLILPPSHPWYRIKAVESYRRLHQWLQAAFQKAGFETELSPSSRQESLGQCFVGAEQFDLLWKQRKIAGAAQRRTRHGLLIQGSIQPPSCAAREDWQKALCADAQKQWGVEWLPLELDPIFEQRVRELAAAKYARRQYNARR